MIRSAPGFVGRVLLLSLLLPVAGCGGDGDGPSFEVPGPHYDTKAERDRVK